MVIVVWVGHGGGHGDRIVQEEARDPSGAVDVHCHRDTEEAMSCQKPTTMKQTICTVTNNSKPSKRSSSPDRPLQNPVRSLEKPYHFTVFVREQTRRGHISVYFMKLVSILDINNSSNNNNKKEPRSYRPSSVTLNKISANQI